MAFRPREVTRTAIEPDRVRTDGTKKQSDAELESLNARVAKVTAYEKYKQQLNEFFDGKRELPQNLKDMLATRPGAADHGFVEDEERAAPAPQKKKKAKNGPDARESEKGSEGTRRRVSANADRRNALVAELKKATSPREAETAINGLRSEGFSLPLELELLSKALTHPDESVVAEALKGLLTVLENEPPKSANLLRSRVKNAALLASSAELRELCQSVEARLAA